MIHAHVYSRKGSDCELECLALTNPDLLVNVNRGGTVVNSRHVRIRTGNTSINLRSTVETSASHIIIDNLKQFT